jgi:hypothetical protein
MWIMPLVAFLVPDIPAPLPAPCFFLPRHVLPTGKELIENLTVLRFSNRVFEPLWSRQYIRNVQVRGPVEDPSFV